jgi:hypothetical protein
MRPDEDMIAHLIEKYGCTREEAIRALDNTDADLDEESEANADASYDDGQPSEADEWRAYDADC